MFPIYPIRPPATRAPSHTKSPHRFEPWLSERLTYPVSLEAVLTAEVRLFSDLLTGGALQRSSVLVAIVTLTFPLLRHCDILRWGLIHLGLRHNVSRLKVISAQVDGADLQARGVLAVSQGLRLSRTELMQWSSGTPADQRLCPTRWQPWKTARAQVIAKTRAANFTPCGATRKARALAAPEPPYR